MQALVFRDEFDDKIIIDDLYKHLEGFKIVEVESLRKLNIAKIKLDLDAPCLIYKNAWTRLQNPKEIWEHHNRMRDIKIFKIGTEIVSVIPDTINSYARDINTMTYLKPEMNITNRFNIHTQKVNKPLCFLYTHNRDAYLKFTLNSLLFATQNMSLKIILNDPTPKVREVAEEFAEKYSNVELFLTDNSFISATNLMIQWYNPDRFIFMEDDHIYPPTTKDFFPDFCNQFVDRLDFFDLCLWKVVIDNGNKYIAHRRNTYEYLESEWEIWEPNSSHILMAQCVACKTSYYKDVLRKHINDDGMKKYYSCYDAHLVKNAKSICHPSLRGYHIGWNQEMDGFTQLIDCTRHPTFKSTLFHVENLNTGEKRDIDIRGLIE